jgi:hypothetical protein
VVGYQQLDAHGQWGQDATHGIVWYPYVKAADWAPYREGHWEWIAPWGWTWIDDAPWGFAPFHYGRWALIGSRWAWVPGRIGNHPVYAPALVAFIGGGSRTDWSIASSSRRPGVAWFPLAPGEPWQPGYAASPLYISNVNRNMPPQAVTSYTHQHSRQALTAISADDFHRGRPMRAGWLRATAMALMRAPVIPPPPMPERSSTLARQQQASEQQAEARPARELTEPAHGQPEQMQHGAQAKLAQQQKVANPFRDSAKAKAERQKREQLAKHLEQARHEQRARQQQARLEQRVKTQRQVERDARALREQRARRNERALREAQYEAAP